MIQQDIGAPFLSSLPSLQNFNRVSFKKHIPHAFLNIKSFTNMKKVLQNAISSRLPKAMAFSLLLMLGLVIGKSAGAQIINESFEEGSGIAGWTTSSNTFTRNTVFTLSTALSATNATASWSGTSVVTATNTNNVT